MRILLFISIVSFAIACSGSRNTSLKANNLNGTWVPIRQELAGTPIPSAAFANQKLVISDSNYTFTAENTDKGVLNYSGDKMDIYGKDGPNVGKHYTALYKYEKDELTICYNLSGNGYPENFDTKGKAMYFLCVFKRTP